MATQVSLIKGGKSIFSFIIISRPKKIVHLVRDPRFQAQSRLRNKFPCESGNITGYCQGYEGKCFLPFQLSYVKQVNRKI